MTGEFEKLSVCAVSMKNSSLMDADNKWHKLSELAAKQLSFIKKGDNVSVKFENNFIVWIKKLDAAGDLPKTTPTTTSTGKPENLVHFEDKSDLILAQSTLAQSVQMISIALKNRDLEHEPINVMDLVKTTHKELYKYMKNKDYEK